MLAELQQERVRSGVETLATLKGGMLCKASIPV